MTTLEILRTGPLALVQDLGRVGLADIGVTRSGAADRRSHTLANRLVANPDDRATIEVTFGGFSAQSAAATSTSQSPALTPTRASMESCSAATVFNTSATAR